MRYVWLQNCLNKFRNTLEIVGFDSTGLSGQVRVHGVAAIYVAALFMYGFVMIVAIWEKQQPF